MLAVDAIDLGPFLGSCGRAFQPLGPDLKAAGDGRVVFGGFTLGTPDQAGASGDGVLATVNWRALDRGQQQIQLVDLQLVSSQGRVESAAGAPLVVRVVRQPAPGWIWAMSLLLLLSGTAIGIVLWRRGHRV